MVHSIKRLCVFCGSSLGASAAYGQAAGELGRLLAARGIGLVYGGAQVGLMGVVADAALAGGGEVIGILPRALGAREIAHPALTELRMVGSMHERKQLMHDLSDAFVALPGGLGTLEELLETLTWAQLGLHGKPCGVLNVERYYDPLLALLDHAAAERLLRVEHRALLLDGVDPAELLDRLQHARAPAVPKWITPNDT